MSDKELNTPMNHEQLNTPRELTAKELDMVFGGTVTDLSEQNKDNAQFTIQAYKDGVEFVKDIIKASR
jgi:hypothetical protein